MYCVYAMKYNFYYHISCNRIQLTTMFLLLNVMYIYSSLENFSRCIKCIIIRQVRLCVESKKVSFFILFKEYIVKLFIISSYLKYICVNCTVLAIDIYIFRYLGAHFWEVYELLRSIWIIKFIRNYYMYLCFSWNYIII